MNISEQHKNTKKTGYWEELTSGVTSTYKEQVLEVLLEKYMRPPLGTVIDIGCGTCDMVLRMKDRFQASRAVCMDYDEKIIEDRRKRDSGTGVEWVVGDIFAIESLGANTDLVLFIDMLHEVYSFRGRPDANLKTPVDHSLGLEFVVRALTKIGGMVCRGGGIAITDNVICEGDYPVTVRLKNTEMLRTVCFFFANYPSRLFEYKLTGDVLEMNSRDLCILLSQYNKIKNNDLDRWETEKYEIHQYMTLDEYKNCFDRIGFDCHAVVGTPCPTRSEWEEDFDVLEGLDRLPEKRITLLAIKR